MDCDRVRALHQPYLDGQLTDDVSRRLNGHFASCSSCAALLQKQKEFNVLLSNACKAQPMPEETRAKMRLFFERLPVPAKSVTLPEHKQSEAITPLSLPSPARHRPLWTILTTAALVAFMLFGYQMLFCQGECPYMVSASGLHEAAKKRTLHIAVAEYDEERIKKLMREVLTIEPILPDLNGEGCTFDGAGRVTFEPLRPYDAPDGVLIEFHCPCREEISLFIHYWPENHPRKELEQEVNGRKYWIRREVGCSVVCWKTPTGFIYTLAGCLPKEQMIGLAEKIRTCVEKQK